jgi:hypothetical protein
MYVRPQMPYQPNLHGLRGFGTPPYRGKGVWVKHLRGLGQENMTIMPRNVIWDPASLNYKPHGYYTDPSMMRPVGPYQNQPGNIPQPFSRASTQRSATGGPAGLSAYAPWGGSNRKPLYPLAGLGTDDTQSLLNKRQQAATKDQNPTNYASPMDAIGAGLQPGIVNAAWASAMAKFPTMQAAIAAGIAPAVVIQYWNMSRTYRVPMQGMGDDPPLFDTTGTYAYAPLTAPAPDPTVDTTGTYAYPPLYDPSALPAPGFVAAPPGGAGASGGASLIPGSQTFSPTYAAAAPSTPAFSLPSISTNTLMLAAAGIAAFALVGGNGGGGAGKKRRR